MFASKTNSVVIGILGYGNRIPSKDALSKLDSDPNVEGIILYWNQPGPDVEKALDEVRTLIPSVRIAISPDNLGSASGYARLIENFRDKETAPYLLLLDDDLRLAPDCILNLISAARLHIESLECMLFLANRPDLPELANLIGKQQGIMKPRTGCCVGFHFLNLINPLREEVRQSAETGLFTIDSAPWGGLLIPRLALAKLGLPREDFFLYAEDSELTYRFTWNGGKILLVPNAEITDTEPAWNTVGGNISNLRRRVLVLPEIKVFHEVRNRNYMARHYYPGLLPVYWMNKLLFLGSAYLMGIANGKFARARLIHRAVNAGEHMADSESSSQQCR